MPTRTFDGDHSALQVGNLEIELLRFDIHCDDATVIRVPSLGILLVGDTVEDTITYLTEPGRVTAHVADLDRMRGLEFERVFPSHGSFETIRSGGYGAGLILATRNYLTRLLETTTDPPLRRLTLREFVKRSSTKDGSAISNRTSACTRRTWTCSQPRSQRAGACDDSC